MSNNFITDAFKSNPVGTIAGGVTVITAVGVPLYKWLSARSGKLAAENDAAQAEQERLRSSLESQQKIKALETDFANQQAKYKEQIEELKNDDVIQELLVTKNELEKTKQQLVDEKATFAYTWQQITHGAKEVRNPETGEIMKIIEVPQVK